MFVIGRKSFHVAEACYCQRVNSSFAAACHHNIGIAILNDSESFANTVGAGCTCGYNSHVGAFKAKSNGNLACRHIRNFHRNKERADFGRAFFNKFQGLFQVSMHAANAAAYANACSYRVNAFKVKFGIFNSHFCCSNRKLGNAVHAFAFFFIAVFGKIKILYFTGNSCAVFAGIKLGNRAYAGFTCNQIVPKFIFADTDRGNSTYTGYNNSSLQNKSPQI